MINKTIMETKGRKKRKKLSEMTPMEKMEKILKGSSWDEDFAVYFKTINRKQRR